MARAVGRGLLAMLFVAGVVQKVVAPAEAQALLEARGLPVWLVWPAAALNLAGAVCLLTGLWLCPAALVLAAYCAFTSVFHFIPSDGWQMSIFVKNWAIAGGLLILAADPEGAWPDRAAARRCVRTAGRVGRGGPS